MSVHRTNSVLLSILLFTLSVQIFDIISVHVILSINPTTYFRITVLNTVYSATASGDTVSVQKYATLNHWQILITIIKMINYKHEFIFNTELLLIVFIM